ncbi:universal stress protein [Bacillus licheniformis]|nr:universal stress protein [Bacillus licheniformis]
MQLNGRIDLFNKHSPELGRRRFRDRNRIVSSPAIVSYANHHDVDIVIIGSRGLNTLQEMVLGSVSHKVAKRVKCPVLIVK